MKKLLKLLLVSILVLPLSACGSSTNEEGNKIDLNLGGNKYTEVNVGDKIELDFGEITIDSINLEEEKTFVSDSSGIKITSGIYDLEGEKYFYIQGKFKNLAGTAINFSNTVGTVKFDDKYEYAIDFHCVENGSNPCYNVDPLITVDYVMYVSIPDELVESYSEAVITFGFDNEFSHSFTATVDECEYQYQIKAVK